jgi:DNA polymerase-3 subunit delta'
MVEFFYKQIEAEAIFTGLLQAGFPSHAILLLGDQFKCDIFATFAAAKALNKDILDFARDIPAHPDFVLLAKTEEASTITVDDIRTLKQAAQKKTCAAPRKACVIQAAQRMMPAAQNALLKLIEEPPGGICFLLTAPDKAHLLSTILSRVVSVILKPLTNDECAKILKLHIPQIADAHSVQLSDMFNGNLDLCIQFAQHETANEILESAKSLAEDLNSHKLYKLMTSLGKLKNRSALHLTLIAAKHLLIEKCRSKPGNAVKILPLVGIINEALERVYQNANLNLTISWLLASLCAKNTQDVRPATCQTNQNPGSITRQHKTYPR